MSARETAELLMLAGRLVQAEGYDGKLSPAQWMALRYFARANTFSRTPSAFAEFQATTRGTASQAIKALEAGGYLVRDRSQADGRSRTLPLPRKGHAAVARDPFEVLVRAVARRPAPGTEHCSCEWSAPALWCVPGLRVSRWRNTLRLDESEPVGPRVPPVRRAD